MGEFQEKATIMDPEPRRFEATVEGKTFIFETGHVAGQAGGAVTLQVGETLLFGINQQPIRAYRPYSHEKVVTHPALAHRR